MSPYFVHSNQLQFGNNVTTQYNVAINYVGLLCYNFSPCKIRRLDEKNPCPEFHLWANLQMWVELVKSDTTPFARKPFLGK